LSQNTISAVDMAMLGHTQVCATQRPSQVLNEQFAIFTVQSLPHTFIWLPVCFFGGGEKKACHYVNQEALQINMLQWLQRRESNFYHAEIHTLVQRWKQTVDKDGDYFEN
jgi:hypothetical protein